MPERRGRKHDVLEPPRATACLSLRFQHIHKHLIIKGCKRIIVRSNVLMRFPSLMGSLGRLGGASLGRKVNTERF
jgi:hypothetical protein